MLSFVVVLVLAVIGSQAAPQSQPAEAVQQPTVQILNETNTVGGDGTFSNRCVSLLKFGG